MRGICFVASRMCGTRQAEPYTVVVVLLALDMSGVLRAHAYHHPNLAAINRRQKRKAPRRSERARAYNAATVWLNADVDPAADERAGRDRNAAARREQHAESAQGVLEQGMRPRIYAQATAHRLPARSAVKHAMF